MAALSLVRCSPRLFTHFVPVCTRTIGITTIAARLCNVPNPRDSLGEVPFPRALLSRASQTHCQRYDALVVELNELREILNDGDDSLRSLVVQDFERLSGKFGELQNEIVESLTQDEYTFVNRCIVGIEPGVGGQEAMLFAGELFQIYLKYIKWNGWLISSVEDDFNGIGGLKGARLEIKGKQCFRYLRHEAGVHRVQRVPKTERTGRIHTSTVAVSVMPVIRGEQDIHLEEKDLKFEATTSAKPGGQNVNKKPTCIRVYHLPTDTQVMCQETRSGIENKQRALQRLKQLLAQREDEKQYKLHEETRKNQIGDSGRSEKIRTYNLTQDRVTDHRLGDNFYDIATFLAGDPQRLHEIILKLESQRKQQKLQKILT
ncbi:mitochondrial translation release factor 1 [Brevipalpus obovatus]|uniref:mitochondrial translation release factor 1 n=1 Tax=Brevipalpus obovatus TaxID=246614 RepID=UPI003D9EE9AF